MSAATRSYIASVILLGATALVLAASGWQSQNLFRFFTYMLLACLSAGLKVKLPGVQATLSGAFLVVVLSIAALSTPETVVVALTSALVQYAWHSGSRLRVVQAGFNVSNVAVAAYIASLVLHSQTLRYLGFQHSLSLALASVVYFAGNCLIVSVVIVMTDPERRTLRQVITEYYLWSLPFYLFGAALAEVVRLLEGYAGWQTALLVVPAIYALYQVWTVYGDRVEGERARQEQARIHAEQMSALHVRTIHALAMAIEARDRTTHDHLRRVQIYAVELGRLMGLDEAELEALRTAAVLHDIGKLAVPEHIISKPGRLTPEEFQKVQAHPVVGAEILERVDFPYGVVPIVRCHHERWDGSGYPSGLKREEIPIGARILSVVDCFDALASDRQYRKAMSTDEAIQVVIRSAGKDFDPQVVSLLASKYRELEEMVRNTASMEPPMMTRHDIKAAVPLAGLQKSIAVGKQSYDVGVLIRATGAVMNRQTTGLTFGASLLAGDCQLQAAMGYDYLAVYVREGHSIELEYLTGTTIQDQHCHGSVGQGLSGWVIEEGRPILNGNGRLDSMVAANTGNKELVSAASVPILIGERTAGALTVYSRTNDAFGSADLQVLWAVSAEIGAWLLERLVRNSTADLAAALGPSTAPTTSVVTAA